MKAQQPTYELIATADASAVQVLYERYGKKLVAYALHTWELNEDEAWDLCYKTLYRILDVAGRYTFASEEKFGAMVFTTFINYVRNHYRDNRLKKQQTVELSETHLAVPVTPSEQDIPESLHQLQVALDALEDWERILLLLRSQNVPYAEIAKLMHKPEQQLKVYYMRLKKKLHDQLKNAIQLKINPQ